MFLKALSHTLNWKYHTKINISRFREVIALFFEPSKCIAVIVVGMDHILVSSSPLVSAIILGSGWIVANPSLT